MLPVCYPYYLIMLPWIEYTEAEEKEFRLKQTLLTQYYSMLHLLHITHHFKATSSRYAQIDFTRFEQLSFVGLIRAITITPSKTVIIHIITALPLSRTSKSKELVLQVHLPFPVYEEQVIIFNRAMPSQTSRQPQEHIAFTSVRPILIGKQIVFIPSNQTDFVILQPKYYQDVLEPFEKFTSFPFNQLDLFSSAPSSYEGVTLAEIQGVIAQRKEGFSAVGYVSSIAIEEQKDKANKREKEFTVQLLQDSYQLSPSSMGSTRIIARYIVSDQRYVFQRIIPNKIYLFLHLEPQVSDVMNLSYRIPHWQDNVFLISDRPMAPPLLQYHLRVTPLQHLLKPVLMRNFMRFRVCVNFLKLIYGKVVCEKCGMKMDRQAKCSNTCLDTIGRLDIWFVVGVEDQSGPAEISLENQVALAFFEIEEEYANLKHEIMNQDNLKEGVTIYFGTAQTRTSDDKMPKNPYFNRIVLQLRNKFMIRDILGIPRANLNQNYNGLSYDEKLDFQTSFLNTKNFLKRTKANVNGYIVMIKNERVLMPYIKVIRVLGNPYAPRATVVSSYSDLQN